MYVVFLWFDDVFMRDRNFWTMFQPRILLGWTPISNNRDRGSMTRKFGHAQVCKLPGSTCRTTDFLSYVTNQTRPLPSVFGPFVKKNVGKVELIGCLPRVLTRRPVTLRCSKSHQVKTIQLNTYRGNKGYL